MAQDALHQALTIARNYDYHDPAYREPNEPELLDLFLEHLPTFYSPRTQQWSMFGYDECRAVLEDAALFKNDVSAVPVDQRVQGVVVLGQDFPVYPEHADDGAHRDYRRGLNPLFSETAIASRDLEPHVRQLAAELLDPMIAKGEFDLIHDFAIPFPTLTFCALMGIPLDAQHKIKRIVDIFLHVSSPGASERLEVPLDDRLPTGEPKPEVQQRLLASASTEIVEYFGELFDERRAAPRDDILTKLLEIRRENGDPLSEDELTRIAYNLVLGGLDTTTAIIGGVLWDFANRPSYRKAFIALMDDPKALQLAVAELVRYHSIVLVPRVVGAECEFKGLSLRQHEILNLDLTAACRDPRKFDNPHELDFARQPNPHLGFGHGRHRCLGMHVARLELRVALQEIHRRMPEYEVVGEPKVIASGQRGIESLRLRVTP